MFTVILLALSQISIRSNSLFTISIILSKIVPSMKTLVSYANKIENRRSELLDKSSMYIINRRGPKIGPSGTPWVTVFLSESHPL